MKNLIWGLLVVLLVAGAARAEVCRHPVMGEVSCDALQILNDTRMRDSRAAKRDALLGVKPQSAPEKSAPVIALEAPAETPVPASEQQVAQVSPKEPEQAATAKPETQQKKWGSFTEFSVWGGAWVNPSHDTTGLWVDLKYLKWFTQFGASQNFGLGARLRGDYGWNTKSKADWGYVAPGLTLGYYQDVYTLNSFETDLTLFYRFDKRREDGLMPSLHAEFNRILSYRDRLTFQVDGNYFGQDSWLGPGVYWERRLAKDWKLSLGLGASLGWLDGDFLAGFAPSIKVKWQDRITLGLTSNLFAQGSFFGIIAAYESAPDVSSWQASRKQLMIKQQKEADPVPAKGIEFKTYQQMQQEEGK